VKDRWIITIKGIDVKTGKLELFDQLSGFTGEDLITAMPLVADRIIRIAKGEKLEKFDAKNGLVHDNTKEMPAAGLILYLPMDSNAKDDSPSKNNGTAIGMSLTGDRFGRDRKAYHFKKQIAYISLSQKKSSPESFSIAAWIKTDSTSGGRIAGFSDRPEGMSDFRDKQLYMHSSGRIYFGVLSSKQEPVTITSGQTYNDGEWHFVVGSFSNGILSLYIDGETVAASKRTTVPFAREGYWRVGYDIMNGWPGEPSAYTLDGDIDDLRIYSRGLSESEMHLLYHQNGFGK
ncbi:MAG TPA: LamG domain-containing protein, partial [Spirochaetota bacterium]